MAMNALVLNATSSNMRVNSMSEALNIGPAKSQGRHVRDSSQESQESYGRIANSGAKGV